MLLLANRLELSQISLDPLAVVFYYFSKAALKLQLAVLKQHGRTYGFSKALLHTTARGHSEICENSTAFCKR
jgi:hypothetical protein